MIEEMNLRERAIYWTKHTGVLPAIKLKENDNIIPYITPCTPEGADCRDHHDHAERPGTLRAIAASLKGKCWLQRAPCSTRRRRGQRSWRE
jgi:hypothetical protein